MKTQEETQEWQETLRPGSVRELFEHLPNLLFFVKDRSLKLMGGNRAFVERCGFREERQLIGMSDRELFPVELAEKYYQDDVMVIESGKPLTGIVEVFPNPMGEPEWFVTDKVPLFGRDGEVAGLCGMVRSYDGAKAEITPYLEMLPATEYLKVNYAEKFSIETLATKVGLSVRQFERKFRKTFNTSPRKYVLKFRVLRACELLVKTDLSVTEVALQVGFFDHSALTKHFTIVMGVAPGAYRKRWKKK